MLDYKNQRCPSTWKPYLAKKACGRISGPGCSSVILNTGSGTFRQICGRVRAFQWGGTDAFAATKPVTIDGPYVDGISITRASDSTCSPTPLGLWSSITRQIMLPLLRALVPEELNHLCSSEAQTITASRGIRTTSHTSIRYSATLCGTVRNADITRSPAVHLPTSHGSVKTS